jgi:ubiquinone/menaquinone biosynthesis C-methylase UbiE
MSAIIDNKTVFSTVEFDSWAHRTRLIPAEKFLIENYLVKRGKTLEAGTAGGKILFEMKAMGFDSLHGFDFVPEFIEQARKKDVNHEISFEVGDAVSLKYEDSSFDQLIYLQQIISFIEGEEPRLRALQEAYRILKTGGVAVFSFLSFDIRVTSPLYYSYVTYLRCLRMLRRSSLSIHHLPWLKLGGTPNIGSLFDKGPYGYWYSLSEIHQLLNHVGFKVTALGSTRQIDQGVMKDSYDDLVGEQLAGMLYIVCTK